MYHHYKQTLFGFEWRVFVCWLPIVFLSQDPTHCVVSVLGDSWSQWESWEPCDVTCGGGSTARFRQCQSPSGGRGTGCSGQEISFGGCGGGLCTGGGGNSPQQSHQPQPAPPAAGAGGYDPYDANPGQGAQGGNDPYNANPAPAAGPGGYDPYNANPGQAAQGGNDPYNANPAPAAGAGGYDPYDANPGQAAQGGNDPYNANPGPAAGPGGYDSNPQAGQPDPYNSNPGPPAAAQGGYDLMPQPGPLNDDSMIDTLAQSPHRGANAGGAQRNPMLIRDEVINANGLGGPDTHYDNEFPLRDNAGSGAASLATATLITSIVCIVTYLCLPNFN